MGNSEGSIFDRLASCCGNINLCLRPEFQSAELQKELAKFDSVSIYIDPYFGQCHALKSKNGEYSLVLVKQNVDLQSHSNRLALLQQLCNCSDGPANKNIIRTQLIADMEKTGFLWSSRQLYVLHDFIVIDLHQQFQHRLNNQRQFSEEEIKTIVKQCTKGYLRMEATEYASVRMDYIYFCGKDIKIAHPRLFNYTSNYMVAFHDYNAPASKNIYVSPQELTALERGQPQFIGGEPSNAFSFGMVILSLMTMRNLNYIYDYRNCSINHDEIALLIRQCNGKYSYNLISIVQDLLKPTDSTRLTLKNLLSRIESATPLNNFIDLLVVGTLGKKDEKDGALTLEEIKDAKSTEQNYKLKQTPPKYPNFISAYLKPRVSMAGEYVRLEEDDPIGRYTNESVVANQRLRYNDQTSARNSVGSYVGQVLNVEKLKETLPMREGKGLYQHSDGQSYIGEWHMGQMEGYGKLYFANKKLRYEGEFKNGKFHGQGVEYAQNQIKEREEEIDAEYVKIFNGNWIKYQGYYIQDQRNGAGKIYFRKGYWKGNFKSGQANGEGVYYSYLTGRETKGRWKEGELFQMGLL